MAASIWSASDAAAAVTPTTLSNGGLTFTPTVNSYTSTLRTTVPKSSGKLYIEFYAESTGGNVGWALANAAVDPSRGMSQGTNPNSGAFYYGNTAVTAGFTAHFTSTLWPSSGYVVAMAVDFTTGNAWFAFNNAWVGGGDPAANTLPMLSFDFSVTGPLYVAAGPGQVSDTWDLHATAASQKYAPPAGFSAWDAVATLTPSAPALMIGV